MVVSSSGKFGKWSTLATNSGNPIRLYTGFCIGVGSRRPVELREATP
jgi:hypothetical protein